MSLFRGGSASHNGGSEEDRGVRQFLGFRQRSATDVEGTEQAWEGALEAPRPGGGGGRGKVLGEGIS